MAPGTLHSSPPADLVVAHLEQEGSYQGTISQEPLLPGETFFHRPEIALAVFWLAVRTSAFWAFTVSMMLGFTRFNIRRGSEVSQ